VRQAMVYDQTPVLCQQFQAIRSRLTELAVSSDRQEASADRRNERALQARSPRVVGPNRCSVRTFRLLMEFLQPILEREDLHLRVRQEVL